MSQCKNVKCKSFDNNRQEQISMEVELSEHSLIVGDHEFGIIEVVDLKRMHTQK